MILHWLITLLFLAAFLFLLKKSKLLKDETVPFLLPAIAFTVKVACGIAYAYIDAYSGHPGDGLNYFWDANWIFKAVHENPLAYFQMLTGIGDQSQLIRDHYYHYLVTWKVNEFDYFFNDSHTIVRLHAFIRLFSFGIYNVHVIVFTFLSFIGQILLYKTFRKNIKTPPALLFILIFFLPSSLVWFSGTMKEPIVMLGLGMLVWHLQQCVSATPGIKNFGGLLLAVFILLLVRFYILLCILPGALILVWLAKNLSKAGLKAGLVYLVFFLTALSFDYFTTDYKLSQILHDQLMNSVRQVEYYNPAIKVEYTPINPTMADLVIHSPAAFLKTWFAPYHRILTNPYRFIFFAENIIILLFAYVTLRHFKKALAGSLPLLLFSASFILFLYILIGLTTPYEGSMVRFRSPAIPFVLFILLSFTNNNKIVSQNFFHNLGLFKKT